MRLFSHEGGGWRIVRKRYSAEDALMILRSIDVHLYGGLDLVGACRKVGIPEKTH